jgi:DNA-directed RNA polymerase II subunit RPB2
MDIGIRGDEARELSEHLLKTYFHTQDYPFTRHHIESYDQFLSQDLPAIIRAENPIILLHDPIGDTNQYTYKAEVFVGGMNADNIYVGTPTVTLKDSQEVRLLFPNEARLRNLTYSSTVDADIVVRITHTFPSREGRGLESRVIVMDPAADEATYGYLRRFPLFRIPIMLHSRYCLLHGKPQVFLKEVGECRYDSGGYFIVNGAEKVLVTHQQRAFNTLDITVQNGQTDGSSFDPMIEVYARISCLNPTTRQVRAVAFAVLRGDNTIHVSLPMIRKEVPLFVLFRALGVQSDEDIVRMIFPNPDDAETKILSPYLRESMVQAHPFYDTYSAIQFIKVLTKGYGIEHVLDVLHNKMFVHVEDRPYARAAFLADCVRRILRVKAGIDPETDRDDTRNQRCIASGVLCRMLFQGIYDDWVKATRLTLDRAYKEHKSMYQDKMGGPTEGEPYKGTNFQNIFNQANLNTMFRAGEITEQLMRAFKGKWKSGSGVGVGEEKTGVIQSLSRLSYMDFMSHCRRVVLDFDTGMKLPSPRRLHTSQYGYFCTSETPGGASIGVTKNMSMLTLVSVATDPAPFIEWLLTRGGVISCEATTPSIASLAVPVYMNNGIVGYTLKPIQLRNVLKAMKWTGCLPATTGVEFSPRERRLFIFMDEGRPMRPLIHLLKQGKGQRPQVPVAKLRGSANTPLTWRQLVLGGLAETAKRGIYNTGFVDPFPQEATAAPTLENYLSTLAPHIGVIEYLDPYEMNETYIANFPEHIQPETSHLEVHPSTIVGLLTSVIPFANHNQSPRNQLSCSQSKQGLSVYSTGFPTRYDNQVHVLCYAQAPIVRTLYYDYIADGQMGYGHNLILAMGSFTGYNQDDGIVMNADSIARGMFRSTCYRSYVAAEENDPMTEAKTRIGNPANIPGWTSLKMGLDYTKLDARGIVRVGEMVDENTVLVGRYTQNPSGSISDASVPAQVWTRGRVEKVAIVTNNNGLSMVKVRVVQERVPELGDKFCLTPDHEVLTKEGGWLPIDKVQTSHTVAQLNRVSGKLEYVKPKEVFEFDHTGDMYEVKSQGVNLCTTLNHRMWVQERYSKEYVLKEAKDMMGRRVRFSSYSPTSATPFEIIIGNDTLRNERMNAFITLFGIWMAEGWVYKNDEHHLFRIEICANKARVKAALDSASEVLGLQTSYNEKTKKYYINTKEYVELFEPLSLGAIHKALPKWCFELSEEQSKLLLESMCLGDGHETATSLSYSTSSKQLRDDLQIIVQHAGYTSGYYKHVEEGSTRVDSTGRIYKANADNWHIQIRRKRVYPTLNHGHAHKQGGQSEEIIQYAGKVYCLSVPSEVFLVRRAGTIVWTGNSNRHGQKGTIGMLVRSYDMPRTKEGIPVDMIMNPHAMPSRMTVAQLIEAIVGKAAPALGCIGNGTLFMNQGNPMESIGKVLRDQLGMEPMGEELMYDGMSGQFVPSQIFVGSVYTMRLKHMPEDKWNARGAGRREQRTHQPTAGRGAQGGLRIGEMERDAIQAHGVTDFMRESYMKRSDGYSTYICNGCGTIPIYNESEKLFICSMCDGPVRYIGSTAANLEIVPPNKRSVATFSKVEVPYAFKLLDHELNAFLNMSMRVLTAKDMKSFSRPEQLELSVDQEQAALQAIIPARLLPEAGAAPQQIEREPEAKVDEFNLAALGAADVRGALQAIEAAGAAAAGEAAGAVAEAAAPVAAASGPAGGLMLNLQPAAAAAAAMETQQAAQLQEATFEDVPYAVGAAAAAPMALVPPGAAAAPPPGTVNVQTGNQPLLIVPMDVGQQAVPTQMFQPPAPGAPATLAVDTGMNAMRSANLLPTTQRPVGRALTPNRARPAGMSGGPVTVNKMGAAAAAANSNPNVRVTVNKTG